MILTHELRIKTMVLINFRSQYLNAYWVLSQLPLCSPYCRLRGSEISRESFA
jgi:hypothetical protein